ncbi:MAG: hypothetical protein V3R78_06075 [Thermodesulfobacteriota bacterium]
MFLVAGSGGVLWPFTIAELGMRNVKIDEFMGDPQRILNLPAVLILE